MTLMGPRRPKWVGWVPSGILVLGIIGAGIGVAVVMGQGLAEPAPPPTTGQVTDLNWSAFSEKGLAYIDRARIVRFNLTEPPIETDELGLPDDGTIVIGPDDTGLDYSLTIFGGGEYPAGVELPVIQLSITSKNGVVTSIDAVPREIEGGFASVLSRLERDSDLYGWTIDDRAEIIAGMGDATRAEESFSFTVGPADRLGVPISVETTCNPGGVCDVLYIVSPAVSAR